MERKIGLIVLVFCLSLCIKAQIKPVFNVSGPEVSNLGEYGTIPVGHYTGVPDISIPLYNVQIGDYELPISLSYHLASVKPTTAPGILGAGWSLKAGGYIARSVRGRTDEKMDDQGIEHGYYAHADKIAQLNESNIQSHFANYLEVNSHNLPNKNWYELAADEFSFNFCGYSGNFYYKGNGEWAVISDQDIKIEFVPTTDFLSLDDVSKRIPINNWIWQSTNQRFFGRFTLITPDGCRYEFGGINAMEFSIPYYARNNSDLVASTWMLSKITTPSHRVVSFTYDTNPVMANIKYMPQYSEVYKGNSSNQEIFMQTGLKGFTGFLLYPVNLKSISTQNETITLDYQRDLAYSTNFGRHSNCLYWNTAGYDRQDIYLPSDRPENQFLTLFKIDEGLGSLSMDKAIAYSLKHYYLHRIAIRNLCGGQSRSIYFDYKLYQENLLSLVTFREGVPDLIKRDIQAPHPEDCITVLDIPELPDTVSVPEYKFRYISQDKGQVAYGISKVDSWGYYCGGTNSITAIPSFGIHLPNVINMKKGVLSSICYPTGGRSNFDYEYNSYSKVVSDNSHSILNHSWSPSGGLRIKEIQNIDKDGATTSITRYHYKENIGDFDSKSSGISKGRPCIKYSIQQGDLTYVQASEGGMFPDITNYNSPDVGYSCVIEETLDSANVSQGYIKYRYSNYDTDIWGNTHKDVDCYYSTEGLAHTPLAAFSSRSFERGKLLSKEYYSKEGKLLRTEKTAYTRVNDNELLMLSENFLSYSKVTGGYPAISKENLLAGIVYGTRLCAYLPTKKIITENYDGGTYSETCTYTYNSSKLLTKDSILCSNNNWIVKSYTYPADVSNYKWMSDKHILSPLVSMQTSKNGKFHYEENVYGNKNGIPYIRSKRYGRDKSNYREEYFISKTDDFGNPLEITQDGRTSILLWGHYGQRQIARFDNVTYHRMQILLGTAPETFSRLPLNQLNYQKILGVRRKIPTMQSTIYQYDGNMQLRSLTDISGFTNYFKYDFFGRLREKYFFNGNKQILESYDYHYQK